MDWDAIERTKRRKRYAERVCPTCGRTIREGAWGSKDSNWKKHAKAHERPACSRCNQPTCPTPGACDPRALYR